MIAKIRITTERCRYTMYWQDSRCIQVLYWRSIRRQCWRWSRCPCPGRHRRSWCSSWAGPHRAGQRQPHTHRSSHSANVLSPYDRTPAYSHVTSSQHASHRQCMAPWREHETGSIASLSQIFRLSEIFCCCKIFFQKYKTWGWKCPCQFL